MVFCHKTHQLENFFLKDEGKQPSDSRSADSNCASLTFSKAFVPGSSFVGHLLCLYSRQQCLNSVIVMCC